MLKTKLLSVFVAFALIITVGGVYATWSYAGSNLSDIAPADSLSITATISKAEVIGAPGTLSVSDHNIVATVVNAGDYRAQLNASGGFVVTYTPNEGTDINEVDVQIKFVLNQQAYAPAASNKIFKFASDAATTNDLSGNYQLILTRQAVSTGENAWTVDFSDFAIEFTENFVLDTVAKHGAFKQVLEGTHLEIDISVVTNEPAAPELQ